MIYIYDTILYKSTTNVVNAPASNATDLSDFTTNFLNQVLKVDVLMVQENSAEIDKTYTQFKALIVAPLTWADVKCLEGENTYELHLITDNPI